MHPDRMDTADNGQEVQTDNVEQVKQQMELSLLLAQAEARQKLDRNMRK